MDRLTKGDAAVHQVSPPRRTRTCGCLWCACCRRKTNSRWSPSPSPGRGVTVTQTPSRPLTSPRAPRRARFTSSSRDPLPYWKAPTSACLRLVLLSLSPSARNTTKQVTVQVTFSAHIYNMRRVSSPIVLHTILLGAVTFTHCQAPTRNKSWLSSPYNLSSWLFVGYP